MLYILYVGKINRDVSHALDNKQQARTLKKIGGVELSPRKKIELDTKSR